MEDEYQSYCEVMKQKLLGRKYNQDNLNKEMNKVDLNAQKELLLYNEEINSKKNMPLVLTCNSASKHIRSCKNIMAHSTNQSEIL